MPGIIGVKITDLNKAKPMKGSVKMWKMEWLLRHLQPGRLNTIGIESGASSSQKRTSGSSTKKFKKISALYPDWHKKFLTFLQVR
jgi:hypothetical protein